MEPISGLDLQRLEPPAQEEDSVGPYAGSVVVLGVDKVVVGSWGVGGGAAGSRDRGRLPPQDVDAAPHA